MKKEEKIHDYKETKLDIPIKKSDIRYTLITATTIVLFYYLIINFSK